jgi:hypothetical protein
VRSREVLRGTRVRVSEGHRKPELRGLLGTVAQRWGNSDYTALLVRLENGRYELFWDHDRDFKTAFEKRDLVKLDDKEL